MTTLSSRQVALQRITLRSACRNRIRRDLIERRFPMRFLAQAKLRETC